MGLFLLSAFWVLIWFPLKLYRLVILPFFFSINIICGYAMKELFFLLGHIIFTDRLVGIKAPYY